jgi:hypothetical protein
LELADVVADLAVGADAVVVVAGAEVTEAGGGVGQEAVDDDEDGAGGGDEGLPIASPFREAAGSPRACA